MIGKKFVHLENEEESEFGGARVVPCLWGERLTKMAMLAIKFGGKDKSSNDEMPGQNGWMEGIMEGWLKIIWAIERREEEMGEWQQWHL
jgi:hypothetical protein